MKTGILAICIVLIVGVLGLFQFEEFQKSFHNIHNNLAKLETKQDSELNNLKVDVNTLKSQIQVTTTHIANIPKTATDAEKIAEIKYLVFLANARLNIAQDVQGALRALTMASETLSQFPDPNFQNFQESLKNDIIVLKQMSLPNRQNLWSKVGTLILEIKTLSPKGIPREAKETGEKSTLEKDNSSQNIQNSHTAQNTPSKPWKETLTKSFNEIKDLVKIRHHTKPIEPLLSETEQTMIQQNLYALCEEARLAILQQEDEIFHQALREIQQWINDYYSTEDTTIKNLLATLQELSESRLQVEFPTLTSFSTLNTLGEK